MTEERVDRETLLWIRDLPDETWITHGITDAQKERLLSNLRKRINDGLLEGKQLPLTVDLNGVKIRIEEKGEDHAASTQDAQGEAEPEGQGTPKGI